jgi:CheY-like chemotaxis protein/HPt (histidine-containing phosphotransfer) domain-containing protein
MIPTSVAGGDEALRVLAAAAESGTRFELGILDFQMPYMDGLQLAAAIKADPLLESTPLVILTSLGERGHAAAAQAAGVAGYLAKPVREAHLKICLAKVLSGASMATERATGDAPQRRRLVTRHTLSEAPAGVHNRILVAEDNVVNQRIAVKMLEKLGYRVDVASNGLHALEALAAIPYDLVLMDCQMPEMDGFEATRAIRIREDGGRRTPIIAMTANALAGDRDRCLEAGMDGYLAKPVRPDDLIATVSRWLPVLEPADRPADATTVEIDVESTTETPMRETALLPEQGLLDHSQLDDLRALGGADGDRFIADLIGVFLTESGQEIELIKQALVSEDAEASMRAAHRIKGAALDLGCASLADAAEAIEILGRNGDLEGADLLLARLVGSYERTAAALRFELEAA